MARCDRWASSLPVRSMPWSITSSDWLKTTPMPSSLPTQCAQTEGLELSHGSVDTNIVIFDVAPQLGTAAEFCSRLAERGVRMFDDRSPTGAGCDAPGCLRRAVRKRWRGCWERLGMMGYEVEYYFQFWVPAAGLVQQWQPASVC